MNGCSWHIADDLLVGSNVRYRGGAAHISFRLPPMHQLSIGFEGGASEHRRRAARRGEHHPSLRRRQPRQPRSAVYGGLFRR